jgi:hypothetical protein
MNEKPQSQQMAQKAAKPNKMAKKVKEKLKNSRKLKTPHETCSP